MLIFGYQGLDSKRLHFISSYEDIQDSKNDCIVWFYHTSDRDFSLLKFCIHHEIACAVLVENAIDFLLCAHFAPQFLLVRENPQVYQSLADSYLLDSKVLCIIKNISEIERLGTQGIDGVVLEDALGM